MDTACFRGDRDNRKQILLGNGERCVKIACYEEAAGRPLLAVQVVPGNFPFLLNFEMIPHGVKSDPIRRNIRMQLTHKNRGYFFL
jgi:hypothetical protein